MADSAIELGDPKVTLREHTLFVDALRPWQAFAPAEERAYYTIAYRHIHMLALESIGDNASLLIGMAQAGYCLVLPSHQQARELHAEISRRMEQSGG